MKKRFLVIVLVLAFTLSVLPFVFTTASVDGTNVAEGKTYTLIGATQHSTYKDIDGKELTDGVVQTAGDASACCGYSGNTGFSLTIDLGEVTERLKEFELNTTANSSWGIAPAESYEISVCDTADGTFTTVGTVTKDDAVMGTTSYGWTPYVYTLTLTDAVSGRYVRFTVTNGGSGFGYIWGSEIKVIAAKPEAPEVVIPEADKTLVSAGKSYTVSGMTVNATHGDTDSKEMTDGIIAGKGDDAKVCAYAGNSGMSLTLDLGEVRNDLRQFKLNLTTNAGWSVNLPASVVIKVSDTADGDFTDVGSVSASKAVAGTVVSGWTPYVIQLSTAQAVSGRFVRFVFTNSSANGYGYLWGSEAEVFAVLATVSEESVEESVEEPVNESTEESVNESTEESVNESTEESTVESEAASEEASEQESELIPDTSMADENSTNDTPATGDITFMYVILAIAAIAVLCTAIIRMRA